MKIRWSAQVVCVLVLLAALLGGIPAGFPPAGAASQVNSVLGDPLPSTWVPLGTGVDGMVYAIAISGSDVYAGGVFTSAGNCTENCYHIAKWDGRVWSPLGTGLYGDAYTIAVHGSDVYVGGAFNRAGNCTSANGCNHIAKWNGSTWSPLGSGMDGNVRTIAVASNGYVYAGGDFDRAGACTGWIGCDGIAMWNGSVWTPLDETVDPSHLYGGGDVTSLAFIGSDLYMGGHFPMMGQVCTQEQGCKYIARWNGSAWSSVGGGMNNSILALAVNSGSLYAGGWFTQAGGCTSADGCGHIARWDGAGWSPIGTGLSGDLYSTVRALALDSGWLYAGGTFSSMGNCTSGCNNIAHWDGSAWSPLDTGMVGEVWALAAAGGNVYAGGTFSSAGGCMAYEGCQFIAMFGNITGDMHRIYLPLTRR
jgi:trimeric autotransporter adhesin